MAKQNYVLISRDELKTLVQQAGEAGAKEFEKKTQKTAKEKVSSMLYRTKVLLEKYKYLNEYVENQIYCVSQAEDAGKDQDSDVDLKMLMRFGILDDDITLQTTKRNVASLKMILDNVDRMLKIYKEDCESSTSETKKRQWRVIESMYLADKRMTTKEIADKEGQDIRTIQQDAKNAREDLTALIFGLDGMLVRILDL